MIMTKPFKAQLPPMYINNYGLSIL